MTKNEQMNVVEAFPYEGRWFHPGDKFPPAGLEVSAEILKKYEGVYLLTDKALTQRTNPQAHAAQTELERTQAELQAAQQRVAQLEQSSPPAQGAQTELQRVQTELERTQAELQTAQQRVAQLEQSSRTAQSPDLAPLLNLFLNEDGTPPTFEQAVEAARKAQADAKAPAGDVNASLLTDLFPEVNTFDDAVQAVMELQARVKTLEALYPTPTGTDLPQNFVGIGKLRPLGLTTYESLQGKTAEQLDAIEGLTLEKAQQIVDKVSEHFARTDQGGE